MLNRTLISTHHQHAHQPRAQHGGGAGGPGVAEPRNNALVQAQRDLGLIYKRQVEETLLAANAALDSPRARALDAGMFALVSFMRVSRMVFCALMRERPYR